MARRQEQEREIQILTQKNIKRGYDELARRKDWKKMWRSEGNPRNADWFIHFEFGSTLVKMDRERFLALMGKSICKWLDALPNRSLDCDAVHRLSLNNINRKTKNTRGWNVLYILYAGKMQESLGFTPGRYYGSSKNQGKNITPQDDGEWHEIDLCGLKIDRFSGLQRLCDLSHISRYTETDGEDSSRFSMVAPSRIEILDALDAYGSEQPGYIRQVGGLGARGSTIKTKQFRIEPHVKVFVGGKTGNCAEDSLFNAICELKGECFTEKIIKYAPLFTGRQFRDLSKFLENELAGLATREEPGFELRHCQVDGYWQSCSPSKAIERLIHFKDGIFVVHFIGNRGAEHSVVLNAFKRTLIDSNEGVHMKLCKESLELCCGREGILCIRDVRQLIQKRKGIRVRSESRRQRAKRSKRLRGSHDSKTHTDSGAKFVPCM